MDLRLKSKLTKWGDDPGLSGWAQCNYKGSYKSKMKEKRIRERNGKMLCCSFEEEGRGHEPRNTCSI